MLHTTEARSNSSGDDYQTRIVPLRAHTHTRNNAAIVVVDRERRDDVHSTTISNAPLSGGRGVYCCYNHPSMQERNTCNKAGRLSPAFFRVHCAKTRTEPLVVSNANESQSLAWQSHTHTRRRQRLFRVTPRTDSGSTGRHVDFAGWRVCATPLPSRCGTRE